MPIRHAHFFGSKPRGAGRGPGPFRRAAAALLLGALGALFGCAAPAPPEPPSLPRPVATTARKGPAGAAASPPAGSRASGPSRPAAPRGLEALPVRRGAGRFEVDLSWAISDAANLAGYNVYRSEQPGGRVARINPRLLAVPAFRDTTVSAGMSYRYRVSAVDTAGNQSAPSAPVTVRIPKTGRGSP